MNLMVWKRIRMSLEDKFYPSWFFVVEVGGAVKSNISINFIVKSKMCVVPFCVSRPWLPTKICTTHGEPGTPGRNACIPCKLRSEVPICRSAKGNLWTLPSQQVWQSISRLWQLKYVFYCHPKNCGRCTHFDDYMFQMGWFNHQLDVGLAGVFVEEGWPQPVITPVRSYKFLGFLKTPATR